MKKRKIKVLHIIPDLGTGGAERLVLDLIKYGNHKRFQFYLVSLYPKTDNYITKELDDLGLKVFYLEKKTGPSLNIVFELYSLIRKLTPDVIHTHRYVLRYLLPIYLVLKRTALFHTVHNIAEKELDDKRFCTTKIAFKYLRVHPVGISSIITESIEKF